MAEVVAGISSMATRALLAALGEACEREQGIRVRFESVGGVDAAARVRAGERFDLVVLAAEAIDALAAAGHVIAATRTPIAASSVAIAVPAGAPRPDVSTEAALRRAVLAAARIGHSTGPSGSALIALFTRWGLIDRLRDRLVQAPAGTPVAALLAGGQVELGFQQLSELQHEAGIALLGPMPRGLEIVTSFIGAVGTGSPRAVAAQAALAFMAAPAADAIRQGHGMASAASIPTSTSPGKPS